MNPLTLPNGLYDLLLTESLAANLDPARALQKTLSEDESARLAEVLGEQLAPGTRRYGW